MCGVEWGDPPGEPLGDPVLLEGCERVDWRERRPGRMRSNRVMMAMAVANVFGGESARYG